MVKSQKIVCKSCKKKFSKPEGRGRPPIFCESCRVTTQPPVRMKTKVARLEKALVRIQKAVDKATAELAKLKV